MAPAGRAAAAGGRRRRRRGDRLRGNRRAVGGEGGGGQSRRGRRRGERRRRRRRRVGGGGGRGVGGGAAVSEWAVAAMEGLAAAGRGSAPAAPAARLPPRARSGTTATTGACGGVLGAWTSSGVAVDAPDGTRGSPGPVDAGDDQSQNDQSQSLASVLGDDELLARAAAMDVHLPPRATATQAEIAIETVIAMRAGKAGRGDDDDAAAAGDQDRKQPPRDSSAAAAPAGMSAPPPPPGRGRRRLVHGRLGPRGS